MSPSPPTIQAPYHPEIHTHAPLPDPTTHFCLLRLHPATSLSAPLTADLSTHTFASAPTYDAVSYCWGDPTPSETILLSGGHSLPLTRNCHHSLTQVRAQTPDLAGQIWIDSLCIDQSNLDEKSAQVRAMAGIFQGARRVWACLGPEGADSGFLLRELRRLEGGREGADTEGGDAREIERSGPVGEETQRRIITGLVGLGDPGLGRFARALRALSGRPFFSRMWIYQEMFLASEVRMLCDDGGGGGAGGVGMVALKDVEDVCASLLALLRPLQEYDYKEDQYRLLEMLGEHGLFWAEDRYLGSEHPSGLGNLPIFVQQIHRGRRALRKLRFAQAGEGIVQVLHNIRPLLCHDPRDKIFGLVSVFESCGIVPDYTMSCYQLGLRVLREYSSFDVATDGVALAGMLCANLQLEAEQAEVQNAFANLRARENQASPFSSEGDGGHGMLQQGTPWACQICSDESGQLTAPFKPSQSRPDNDHDEGAGLEREGHGPPRQDCTKIMADGRVAALVSGSIAADDWIVPLGYYVSSYYSRQRMGLVLRESANGSYDLIGEAAFAPQRQPCISWENCACQLGPDSHKDHTTRFTVQFDCEELLLLSLRLQASFTIMQQDSPTHRGSDPLLPDGPPLICKKTFASRHDSKGPITSPFKPRVRREPVKN